MPLNGYAVYVTDQTTNEQVELPVNPADVQLSYETEDKSETVINLGEVNIVGNLKLVGLSIESCFPQGETTYTSSDELLDPEDYIETLKEMQEEKHKVQVVVSGTKISILMTISKFTYGMQGGNVDEYLYTLEFKQYREFAYKKISKKKSKTSSKKKKKRSSPPKKVSVGSKVKVNGQLHLDSYGAGAGMHEKNATRTVMYIVPGREYPVCVGINGVARGWVKMSEVKKA